MTDKKLLIAGAAGVAALIAVGGGTFATWSDFQTFDNSAGAGELVLDIGDPTTLGFSQAKMYPTPVNPVSGDTGNREFEAVIASRNGDEVPNASLTITLKNLVGVEDGCTSNGERADNPACDNPGASEGEYITDARLVINASEPTTAASCSNLPRGSRQTSTSLAAIEGQTINLLPAGETLAPGEKICLQMGLNLPNGANNASQGDSATWDFQLDLKQIG